MSKRRQQSDHAMLESWRPARGAGDPVGCLATTFTFDAGFFEEECLARYLEIDSLPDREGLAYLLERENRLGPTYAGVLVDHRQSGVDHSLRWDVLPVRIPRGKQHAKLSLLAWTNLVRIVVASANLTQHGYRSNYEVVGAIDLTPDEADHEFFRDACLFLESLLRFVPGDDDDPAHTRAASFLQQVREKVEPWSSISRRGTKLNAHLAATLPRPDADSDGRSTLADCLAACRRAGGAPTDVWIASPFFDPASAEEQDATTAELCKGMGRGVKRSLTFCVPKTSGDDAGLIRLAAPISLLRTAEARVDQLAVEMLPLADSDKNQRPWHAKMLYLSASNYGALMIGSSNFTKAGMGVAGVRNAEANLVYVARYQEFGREIGALDACWPETEAVDDPDAAEWQGPQPELEEEEHAPSTAVPDNFVSVRYRAGEHPVLVLKLDPNQLPPEWQIYGGASHSQLLLDSATYVSEGSPAEITVPWPFEYAPGKLLVTWGQERAFWSVNVEDQTSLPVPRELEGMSYLDMLNILAASDASAAFRVWARGRQSESGFDEELDSAVPPDLDPLRRYNLQETFLHRVRRQARLLAGVKANLERPVWSEQALQWRLTGLIGVERLVERMAKGLSETNGDMSETVLNLADLLLMLRDVNYRESEGGLSRRRFDRLYKQFLQQLADRLNHQVHSVHGLSRDVRNFWTRVHRLAKQ